MMQQQSDDHRATTGTMMTNPTNHVTIPRQQTCQIHCDTTNHRPTNRHNNYWKRQRQQHNQQRLSRSTTTAYPKLPKLTVSSWTRSSSSRQIAAIQLLLLLVCAISTTLATARYYTPSLPMSFIPSLPSSSFNKNDCNSNINCNTNNNEMVTRTGRRKEIILKMAKKRRTKNTSLSENNNDDEYGSSNDGNYGAIKKGFVNDGSSGNSNTSVSSGSVSGSKQAITQDNVVNSKDNNNINSDNSETNNISNENSNNKSIDKSIDESNSNSNNNNNSDNNENTRPQQTTLKGGPSLIFEMARRMLVWDDELYQGLNDASTTAATAVGGGAGDSTSIPSSVQSMPSPFSSTATAGAATTTNSNAASSSIPTLKSTLSIPTTATTSSSSSPLPRWRPSPILQQSISNINPSFRTSSPIMTNAGYAGILRRNSRKKKKPSMWRHCLRVYGKMEELEKSNANAKANDSSMNGQEVVKTKKSEKDKKANVVNENRNEKGGGAVVAATGTFSNNGITSPGGTAAAASSTTTGGARKKKKPTIQRTTLHHEAALVAASKLGMWEEALKIYRLVEERSSSSSRAIVGRGNTANNATTGTAKRKQHVVTDNMVLSIISACVKGSRVKHTTSSSVLFSVEKNNNAYDEQRSNEDASNGMIDGSDDVNVTANAIINATRVNSTIVDNDDGVIGVDNSNDNEVPTVTIQPPRTTMRLLSVEERRKPLDAARDIILSMEEKHDIPLVSHHVNPLASAYLRLGLRSEAAELINNHLKDRNPPLPQPSPLRASTSKRSKEWKEKREYTSENPGFIGIPLVSWSDDDDDDNAKLIADLDSGDDGDDDDEEEDDDNGYEASQLNIHQVQSKDRGSYSLLVQGAVMDGNWTGAVQELQRMTEVGLYPNSRNLNTWSEVLERGCRPAGKGSTNNNNEGYYYGGRRRKRSWKKKRDGIWLENLR